MPNDTAGIGRRQFLKKERFSRKKSKTEEGQADPFISTHAYDLLAVKQLSKALISPYFPLKWRAMGYLLDILSYIINYLFVQESYCIIVYYFWASSERKDSSPVRFLWQFWFARDTYFARNFFGVFGTMFVGHRDAMLPRGLHGNLELTGSWMMRYIMRFN